MLPSAGQDTGQGQLGDVGGLPAVLDIAQLGDDGPEAHVLVVTSLPSVSIILNLKYQKIKVFSKFALTNPYLNHEGYCHQAPDSLPSSLHVRVQVTVVSKHLDLSREAVMVYAVF